ncbi:MAG: AAA family ATPase, partial [bacterium]
TVSSPRVAAGISSARARSSRSLHHALQIHVARIEDHNRELRARADEIPAATRGELTVEAFCALEPVPDLSDAIQEAERALAAARASEDIREHADFASVELPTLDIGRINAVVQRSLPDLDGAAAARVQAHFATLGRGGEIWVDDGMHRFARVLAGHADEICPFCAQDLNASPLIAHYRAYFSEAYADLRRSTADELEHLNRAHAGDIPAAFERAVRVLVQTREFWRQFTEVPEINLDTAAIARSWKVARDGAMEALRAKQGAPLDRAGLAESVLAAVAEYDAQRRVVAEVSQTLLALNAQIAIIKEQSVAANVAALSADLARLRAVEARPASATAAFCQADLADKAAKVETER